MIGYLHLLFRSSAHLLGEIAKPVSAISFCLVHRHVGTLHQPIMSCAVIREDADADAHRGIKFPTLKRERLLQDFDYLVGHDFSMAIVIQVLDKNGKLVPSSPGNGITLPQEA